MRDEKRALRQALRDRRKALSPDVVGAAGAAAYVLLRAFPPYQAAASIAAYIPDENEVPTAQVIEDVARSGRVLSLPRTGQLAGFVRWRPGDPLVVGPGGVWQPSAGVPEQLAAPAMVLLPVVAWDRTGARLGRGAGFYDRVLADLDDTLVRIGLAYEFQEVPELPRDPWDVLLHYVITERCIVRCEHHGVARPAPLQKGGLQL